MSNPIQDNIFWMLEDSTDEEIFETIPELASDDAKWAAICLLMACESNERMA